jgi:hypothetical protein
MTSFIRISDIPPDELHLLPIIGLRQQIREDRSRPGSPNGRALRAEVSAAEVWAAPGGRFVTDRQLQDEQRPGSRLPFDREDRDEDFGGSKGEDAGGEGEKPPAGASPGRGEDFDILYEDIGGEG